MLLSSLCLKVWGWKTIQQLIDTQSKIVTFKSLKNLAPKYLCELFNKNSACSSRNLRSTNTDVWLPRKNTVNGKKAFSFRGAKIWNSLSTETKHPPSTNSKKIWVVRFHGGSGIYLTFGFGLDKKFKKLKNHHFFYF